MIRRVAFVAVVSFAFAGCASRPTVALLTDYGTSDSYVAELKGAILGANPSASILDLTHEIEAYDIREGAYLLSRAASMFPKGTTFVVVVDPGVGTPRRPIAMRTATGKTFVGPDNGLFSLVMKSEGPCETHALTETKLWRTADPSTTFHGRDIFGPVAGRLAGGVSLAALGPRVDDPVTLDFPAAKDDGGVLRGIVLHVDHYGNVATNIPAAMVKANAYVVNGTVFPRARTYGEVPVGAPVLVVDSTGFAELALNQKSLGQTGTWRAGTALTFEPRK